MTRMGDLREDPPALAQHRRDVSIHLFHAEESLPVVGSVPASLVGERRDLHLNAGREDAFETGPPTSVYAANLTVVPTTLRDSPEPHSYVSRPVLRAPQRGVGLPTEA